jgi:alanine-glyoxylate transaminase / serine-glyoxylate transaminase / serine-pyruvate transaminase
MVDPRVTEALSLPVLGIRDPYFLEVMGDVQTGLRKVFGTTNRFTFPVPGSGSSAMETAVSNFVEPGMKFAIFANGHFGNRMTEMGHRQRANVVLLEKPWGEVYSADEAEEFIRREKPHVVGFVQAETSTGAYQSGRAIAAAARAVDALVIGDCVTSLGAMPVELDANGIDVAYSCSQKGMSCPAGLSPISISDRAWERLSKRAEPTWSWYLDARLMAKYFEAPNVYHHTPASPLYYAMHQALTVIEEEGLEARWERHRIANVRLLKGLIAMGFEPLVARPEDRIWHMTTVKAPAGVDEAGLRQRLLDGYDIEVASGLGQLAGKILRVGTMGPLATDERVDYLLECMQTVLR